MPMNESETRHGRDIGVDLAAPDAPMLYMHESLAYNEPRYYQDATILPAFEKILRCEQAGEAARVLPSLAIGAGKTVIAANLLWRLDFAAREAQARAEVTPHLTEVDRLPDESIALKEQLSELRKRERPTKRNSDFGTV